MISCTHLHRSVTLTNDRGAQYKGILRAILPNSDAMVEVAAIRLTGRGSSSGWQELKRVEVQVVTGPKLTEGSNDE